MKRVLFLAYHFPPVGGAGVQRNAKFVRYLRDFGYDPIIVAGPGRTGYHWTPVDQTLMDDIPPEVEIHRLPGPEPGRRTGWRGRAERLLARESEWERWWTREAVSVGLEVGADVDLVYGSLVPYSIGNSVLQLASALGKPGIVDLQDPWALDEMWIYPTGLHRRHDLRRMLRTLGAADAIVMNTKGSTERILEVFPELSKKVIASIPNGYDSADFEGPEPERVERPFRIVHSGYLHTDLGNRVRQTSLVRRVLGGTTPGLDVLPRSHVYLIQAISELIERKPELDGAVELHLLGELTSADKEVAAPHPFVKLHGYVSHVDTVALARSADLLFLPMHELPAGRRIPIVPGKTYEYLGSGRPILAAVPDGDARELLQEAGSARLCRPSDVEAMQRILLEELDRVRAGRPSPRPDARVLARVERRQLTCDLAELFDQVLEEPIQDSADLVPRVA